MSIAALLVAILNKHAANGSTLVILGGGYILSTLLKQIRKPRLN